MFVVNAGAEDDVGQGIGDMRKESFADPLRIGIEEFLDVFASLSAPVTCSILSLCTAKGTSDFRAVDQPNAEATYHPTRCSCKPLQRTGGPGPLENAKSR